MAASVAHQALSLLVSKTIAADVGYRARSHRRRNGVVGRAIVLWKTRLEYSARLPQADAQVRGTGVSRWPGQHLVPDARRLADPPRPRSSGIRLALHPLEWLLWNDHSERIWRARILGSHAFRSRDARVQ